MPGAVLASGRYRVVADISGKGAMTKRGWKEGERVCRALTLEARHSGPWPPPAGRSAGPPDRAGRYESLPGSVCRHAKTRSSPASYRAPAMVFSLSHLREGERAKISSRTKSRPPPLSQPLHAAGATSTVLEAEDLTNGERRALKVGIRGAQSEGKRRMLSAFRAAGGRQEAGEPLPPGEQTADDLFSFSCESLRPFGASGSPASPLLPTLTALRGEGRCLGVLRGGGFAKKRGRRRSRRAASRLFLPPWRTRTGDRNGA